MFYYLYEIRNNLNGKIYIGVHKTRDMNDGYMGSGKVIQRAFVKHGIENFTKVILETFENAEAMYAREKEVVTDDFLLREDTYNLRRGGNGGWDYINKLSITDSKRENISRKMSIAHSEGRLKQNFKWPMLGIKAHIEASKKGGRAAGGHNRLTENEVEKRKMLIKDVDINKWGHISKISKILGVSHTQAKRFITKYIYS